jgi:DNA-binding transcriptional MerR regulator
LTTPEDAGLGPALSIGELARATGVPAATLRAWEARYGFPVPERLAGGHRRYSSRDVEAVRDVCRRRAAGTRLDAAIAAGRTGPRSRSSLFAHIAERHPAHPRERLKKPSLLKISRAIEDEMAAVAQDSHLFGGFQTARHYTASRHRWVDLARVSASAHVFAEFPDLEEGTSEQWGDHGPVRVALAPAAFMTREWIVVCDSPDLSVTLIASETPGQAGAPEVERTFESIWTVDPDVVRDSSRFCAEVAAGAGSHRATELLTADLAAPPSPDPGRRLVVERLVHRIVRQFEG